MLGFTNRVTQCEPYSFNEDRKEFFPARKPLRESLGKFDIDRIVLTTFSASIGENVLAMSSKQTKKDWMANSSMTSSSYIKTS